MKIKQIYLGTWFQRTSLHLKELFHFLKFHRSSIGLEEERLKHLWEALQVKEVQFIGDSEFDHVEALCRNVTLSISEDGIILLTTDETDVKKAKKILESFYTEYFAPALTFLFSQGAPLPILLDQPKETYPLLLIGQNMKAGDLLKLFDVVDDSLITTLEGKNVVASLGDVLGVFDIQNSRRFSEAHVHELLHYVVFFREFEKQLSGYLQLHRKMWDEITAIREAEEMPYKDFPKIRAEILQKLKILSFVKARIAQMKDIIEERHLTIDAGIQEELHSLGLLKFDHLLANQKYVSHLWQMTIEYVKSSLSLLESLYQENTQRELNAIKFITFGGLVTGFFGMNIAFPWEDRWFDDKWSSFIVILILLSLLVSFYYILKIAIYNRNFLVHTKRREE